MVQVQKLYGVTPTGNEWFQNFMTRPSEDLLDSINELPTGTRTGIDYLSKGEMKELSETIGEIPENTYWAQVMAQCGQRKLDVVYLDDLRLAKEMSEIELEIVKNRERFSGYGEKDKGKAEWLKLHLHSQMLHVRLGELAMTERENLLLQRIGETEPEVVIMTKCISDYLWTNPEVAAAYDISFGEYYGDFPPEEMKNLNDPAPDEIPANVFAKDPPIRPEDLAAYTLTERMCRAARKFRITDGTPDFMGQMTMKFAPEGMFEVYIDTRCDGNRVTGRVEDVYGTATFTGDITDEKLWMTKTYDKMALAAGAFPKVNEGNATRNGKSFFGGFRTQGAIMPFQMWRFEDHQDVTIEPSRPMGR